VAEALKMKEEGMRGGGGGGGAAIASSLGKFGEYPKRLRQFLHDVRVEMKLVNWPSRHDVWSTTIVVVITVAFFGIFFAITDSIFSKGSVWIMHYFRK
jgi:preprotein translocase subunit SecE